MNASARSGLTVFGPFVFSILSTSCFRGSKMWWTIVLARRPALCLLSRFRCCVKFGAFGSCAWSFCNIVLQLKTDPTACRKWTQANRVFVLRSLFFDIIIPSAPLTLEPRDIRSAYSRRRLLLKWSNANILATFRKRIIRTIAYRRSGERTLLKSR